jgi:hypothetical protein
MKDRFYRETALEKSWKVAKENPSDFYNWSHLVTYADEV